LTTTKLTNQPPLTLVLAAGGKTGRRVTERLEERGVPIRRGSRSAEIPFDWDDRSTWEPALAGVRRAYVVYTPDLAVPAAPAAIEAFTELAKRVGVERLVLLSGRGEEEAQRCERIVQASGVPSTVVRASWFFQNFDEGPFAELVQSGEVALPIGDVREPFIDCDDIADVVVAALTEDGHEGELYEVTGPRALTFAEAVAEIADASGRDVHYSAMPIDDFIAGAERAGVPAAELELMRYLFTTVLDGRNEQVTDGVQRALGRAPRDITGYAQRAATAGAWSAARVEVQS
jgi:uncharacterized protein YbjT (DUF2867 family)